PCCWLKIHGKASKGVWLRCDLLHPVWPNHRALAECIFGCFWVVSPVSFRRDIRCRFHWHLWECGTFRESGLKGLVGLVLLRKTKWVQNYSSVVFTSILVK